MINSIKNKLRLMSGKNIFLSCALKRFWRRPYMLGLDFLACYIYSSFLSYKLFGLTLIPKVFFSDNIFRVVINRSKKSKIISNSKVAIIFESFINGVNRTVINIGNDATLTVDNVFYLGDGCRISLSDNAELTLSGESNGQTSGITSDSIIICKKEIYIGSGSIISWGSYITDTSNHYVNGILNIKPVYIGNNVWVSEGCTIAPGANIANGSIVGAKSFVNGSFKEQSLIVGCPAKVKKEGIEWER